MSHPNTAGELVVVATPIGNLGDLSPRALSLLASADAVYCEDTRHSRTLFSANGILPKERPHALHQHNEAAQCAEICRRIGEGQTVVLISDAGTPGISDPGALVVQAVIAAGLRVTTAPGPTAVIAALSISGLPTDRFVMEGFLPRRGSERTQRLEEFATETRTIVFYESPQRLVATLRDLEEIMGSRRVAVVREITKLHEEVLRGTLADVVHSLAERELVGEIVVVLEGAAMRAPVSTDVVRAALVEQLALGHSVRDCVASVVAALGVNHRDTYELALALRAQQAGLS